MPGQEMFGDPGDPAPQKAPVCAWCGEPAKKTFVVQEAVFGYDKRTGVKKEKKHAITAPTCRAHFNRFEEMRLEAIEEKKRLKRERRERQKLYEEKR